MVDIKSEEVPLYEPHAPNKAALNNLLQTRREPDIIVEVVDDMTITMMRGQIIKPLRVTEDGLVKREEDVVSDEMPYNLSVSLKLRFSSLLHEMK